MSEISYILLFIQSLWNAVCILHWRPISIRTSCISSAPWPQVATGYHTVLPSSCAFCIESQTLTAGVCSKVRFYLQGATANSVFWASLMAPLVKNLPAMQETWVQSLGWEDPLEKGLQCTPVFLPGESPWTEEPGRLQSMGLQRVRHDWATNPFTFFSSKENRQLMLQRPEIPVGSQGRVLKTV